MSYSIVYDMQLKHQWSDWYKLLVCDNIVFFLLILINFIMVILFDVLRLFDVIIMSLSPPVGNTVNDQ